MTQSPYRTPPPRTPAPPGPSLPLEVVTTAALVWLASVLRIGVSVWLPSHDHDLGIAVVLLLLMPVLIWNEIAAHRRARSSSQS